ncbi:protein sidekick-2-like isoform X2 [Agrilus planipennis]|uniref:Protein sidekick-2-like isoform X2 n=1 Tax=Agrilus planipennis TaxID=224129 RepID=A0A7F5RHY6_AGRPL|nr:protein sidekick-2-like isoform X2 [Agrilus planipennis]
MWWCLDMVVASIIFSTSSANIFLSNIDLTDVPIESYVVQAGDNTSFPCTGTTEYSLVTELEWRFFTKTQNIKIIEYAKGNTIVAYKQHRISLQSKTHALNFKPIIAQDTGNYICLVNNRPRPDGVLQLIVQDRPDPPGRPLVMGFTSRYVNLSWAAPSDVHFSNVLYYVILIRVGEKGEWNDNGNITPDNRTNYKMTGLKPYSVYSFKVIAVNEMGRSDPSQESYYIITLREIPSGNPTIITAHNTSSSAIHVSWRPPDLDTINGEFMGYRITYKQRKKEHNASEIYIRDPDVKSHVIENLETYTQYLVSVAVFNPEGFGPASTVLVMTDEGDVMVYEDIPLNRL